LREREKPSRNLFFSERPSTNGNVVFLLANHILCKITINESNDNVSLSTEYSVEKKLLLGKKRVGVIVLIE
jgi:hypothetical protein